MHPVRKIQQRLTSGLLAVGSLLLMQALDVSAAPIDRLVGNSDWRVVP